MHSIRMTTMGRYECQVWCNWLKITTALKTKTIMKIRNRKACKLLYSFSSIEISISFHFIGENYTTHITYKNRMTTNIKRIDNYA